MIQILQQLQLMYVLAQEIEISIPAKIRTYCVKYRYTVEATDTDTAAAIDTDTAAATATDRVSAAATIRCLQIHTEQERD